MSGDSPWRTFALVSGAIVIGTLNFTLMFLAFSEIRDSLGATETGLSWAVTAFSITIAALLVPGGWLADRLGRKPVFLAGVAVFTVGSLLVAVAPTVWFLVLARVVQAAGLAVESPAAVALVLAAFPASRRSTAVGSLGGMAGAAAAIGPVVGGALIGAIGWRWTFALNVPIGVATIVVGGLLLRPDRPQRLRRPPDLVGVAALLVGVSAVAAGIVQGNDWGWTSARTLTCLVGGAAMLTFLVKRCRVSEAPILDLSLYRLSSFRVGSVLSFIIGGSFAGVFLTLVLMLTEVWGLSRLQAGMAFALITAIGGPLSVVAGRVADTKGHRAVILPGSVCIAGGALWMLAGLEDDREILALWIPAMALYAVGIGLAHSASQAAAMTDIPEADLGIASAMTRIAQELGAVVSVAAAVAILASTDETIEGVRIVLWCLAGIGATGGLVSLLLGPGPADRASVSAQ